MIENKTKQSNLNQQRVDNSVNKRETNLSTFVDKNMGSVNAVIAQTECNKIDSVVSRTDGVVQSSKHVINCVFKVMVLLTKTFVMRYHI